MAYHPMHDLAPLHLSNFIPSHSSPCFPVPNILAFFQFLNFLTHSLSHRTHSLSYEVKIKYNPYLSQTFKSYLKRLPFLREAFSEHCNPLPQTGGSFLIFGLIFPCPFSSLYLIIQNYISMPIEVSLLH